MAGLEDKVVGEFHDLSKKIKGLEEEKYYKKLKGILKDEVDTFWRKNRDKETHELKWENEEQLKEFTGSLWDKAADHIAQYYLKISPSDIKKRKKETDPDTGKSLWEQFMKVNAMGVDKEDLLEELKKHEYMDPENILEYIAPVYRTHLGVRQNKHVTEKIKTDEDSLNLLTYLKKAKEHLPKSLKGKRLPDKKFKNTEVAQKKYLELLDLIPTAYDPGKSATYEPKK